MNALFDNPQPGDDGDGRLVAYPLIPPAPDPAVERRWRLLGQLGGMVSAVGLLAVAVYALDHMLSNVSGAEIWHAVAAVPILSILAALVLVALSYVALTGYDFLALRHLGHHLPYRTVALGSFLSYAFANNLGFNLLIGGAVRYRIFGPDGVTPADVAVLTAIAGMTFTLSALLAVATSLVLFPEMSSLVLHLPPALCAVIGFAILAGLAAYVAYVGSARRAVTTHGFTFALPGAASTVGQFLVGIADMVCAAGALYLLLPSSVEVDYYVFVSIYAAAIAIGLISHVPGGVGVFETVFLLAVPGVPASELVASLLLYRVIYYLLPFLVALTLLAWFEARHLPKLAVVAASARAVGKHLADRLRGGLRRASAPVLGIAALVRREAPEKPPQG